jgi:hypothetical protein
MAEQRRGVLDRRQGGIMLWLFPSASPFPLTPSAVLPAHPVHDQGGMVSRVCTHPAMQSVDGILERGALSHGLSHGGEEERSTHERARQAR